MQILTQPTPVSSESIDDRVANLLQAGSNIELNYNDVANTLTITNSASAAPTTENIQDIVGALLVAGANVTLNYDDVANTLTISASGGGSSTFLALTDTPDTYVGNALKILRANAAENSTEFGPVLGTIATQNSNNVTITGGNIALTSTVDGGTSIYGLTVTERVLAKGFTVINPFGNNQTAFYSGMNAASGTGRWAIFCAGDAPSGFAGMLEANGALFLGNTADTRNGVLRYTGALEGRIGGAWKSLTVTTFLELTDTPDSYTGKSADSVCVNAAANGLEFFTPESRFLLIGV